MIVSVDKAGRLVLPKSLRDRFRLRAGSRLQIVSGEKGLELRPLDALPALGRKGKLWVHGGLAEESLAMAVQRMRDERLSDLEDLSKNR